MKKILFIISVLFCLNGYSQIIPYYALPDRDSLRSTDYIPVLRAPDLEGKTTLKWIIGAVKDSIGSGSGIDTFYRVSGKDSFYYKKSGVTYRVKDSTGASSWGGIKGALEDQVDLYTELTSINVNVSGKIPYSDTTTLLSVYLKKTDTSTLSVRINQKVDTSSWVDYSSTSTINGFSSYTTKKIQYKKLDNNTLIVQYQIEGTGTNSTHSFTIPFSSSSWGTQYFIGHTLNNGTTQAAGSITLPASSSTVTVNNAASTTASWTNATTQAMRGTLTININ